MVHSCASREPSGLDNADLLVAASTLHGTVLPNGALVISGDLRIVVEPM